jgi:hypothetical protein
MPSPFDLAASLARAEHRLDAVTSTRRRRSDLGKHRVEPAVVRELGRLLSGQEYPGIESILERLRQICRDRELPCPARATVFKLIRRHPGQRHRVSSLPPAVRAALYNVSPEGTVPGAQLAFYCFNYGELPAVCFAAGLPWLSLYQAYRMRGWRAKSRGLLRAALLARGIPGD